MRYRRADTPGATYFFTLNAADRSGQLLTEHIDALRDSFRIVRRSRPFVLDAICVLPGHLHLLTTLPREDADFATRIMLIKQGVSRRIPQGERSQG
ncbi:MULTISPECIES: transposase [unclassified Roseateles]|uniref:REP-associated tyrosine transposase n=1 Tax=unclassified Roseateles TaxID=2626991 RepID=UPI000A4E1861|nr:MULTISPECIES: transposase [unclassified Roseateles]